MVNCSSRIIPAIDKMSLRQALNLVATIGSRVPAIKAHAVAEENLGFTVRQFRSEGAQGFWLDFKDHDMPDTVAERAMAAKDAGVTMLTVHASGGPKMVEAAVKHGPHFIIAVTLLTSYTEEMVKNIYGESATIASVVKKYALWARQGGAHAIVCPPTQVGMLSLMPELGGMKFIVPGTRSAGVAHHDQQQVDSPYNTILNGAHYLVGGRQITQAADPVEALKAMQEEINLALDHLAEDKPTNTMETIVGATE